MDSETTMHTCPTAGCTAQVPEDRLMCPAHWRLVPRGLQRRVYDTWARGTMPDPDAYLAVRQRAIDAVNRRIAS